MKFNILKQDGTKGSSITVDDSVFGIEPNNSVVHQAVVAELAMHDKVLILQKIDQE